MFSGIIGNGVIKSGATFSAALEALNPTHWWRMDDASGNLVDSGSGGANLTPAFIAYGSPGALLTESNNAVDFQGTGDARSGSPLFAASDLSFGGWFKIASGGDSSQRLAGQFVNAGSRWLISLLTATTGLRLIVDAGLVDTSATGLNDDEWHFWVVTRATNTFRVYVDGALSATTIVATSPPASFFEIGLGTGAQDPNGLIDETFIINGTVLSAATIADLYAAAGY